MPIILIWNTRLIHDEGHAKDAQVVLFQVFKANLIDQYQKAQLS